MFQEQDGHADRVKPLCWTATGEAVWASWQPAFEMAKEGCRSRKTLEESVKASLECVMELHSRCVVGEMRSAGWSRKHSAEWAEEGAHQRDKIEYRRLAARLWRRLLHLFAPTVQTIALMCGAELIQTLTELDAGYEDVASEGVPFTPILDAGTGTLRLFNGRVVEVLCLDRRGDSALLCAHPLYFRLPFHNGRCTNELIASNLLLAHARMQQRVHDQSCDDEHCPLRDDQAIVRMLLSKEGMQLAPPLSEQGITARRLKHMGEVMDDAGPLPPGTLAAVNSHLPQITQALTRGPGTSGICSCRRQGGGAAARPNSGAARRRLGVL